MKNEDFNYKSILDRVLKHYGLSVEISESMSSNFVVHPRYRYIFRFYDENGYYVYIKPKKSSLDNMLLYIDHLNATNEYYKNLLIKLGNAIIMKNYPSMTNNINFVNYSSIDELLIKIDLMGA